MMRSVGFRFAAEFGGRWRSWVGVAVLAGVLYGLVMSAAIGGRRTDTVVARSINNKLAPDIFMVPAFSVNGELLDFDAISGFPEVARSFRLPLFIGLDSYDITGYRDMALAEQSGRLLAGRMPDPSRTDEVLVNFLARQERHVRVGDELDLRLAGPGYSGEGDAPPGPEQRVTVVGITAALGDFAPVANPGIYVTPAFVDRYEGVSSTTDLFMFVLKRHGDDLGAFRRHISELTGGEPVFFVEGQNDYLQIHRSFHIQAAAIWILAAFLGLVSVVVLTQTIARQVSVESADHRTLRALGMTRSQCIWLVAWRGLIIAAIAAGVAALLSILTSALMPFGLARMAETTPGLSAPVLLLAVGFVVTLGVAFLQNVVPALRPRRRAPIRPSRVSALVEAAPGARARAGLTLALDPARGADAVPVRSGLAGLTLGVLAVAMSLTVSSSLDRLLDTPGLYGWGWDAAVPLDESTPDLLARIEATPGVSAIGLGTTSAQVAIGSISAEMVSMEPGPIQPVILEGRPPASVDEVALGRRTLRAAHARIGSVVSVGLQGQDVSRSMLVTGVVVLPVESDTSTLGEGLLVTGGGLRAFVSEVEPDVAFVRYSSDLDRADVDRSLRALAGGGDQGVQVPTRPGTVADFGRVRSLPLVLAGLLAGLGLSTIAYVLVSSVARRRRDLAVLKAIGFTSADVRAVVVWEALALVVASLAIGIPLGVAAGRWAWTLFAYDFGFVGEPITEFTPLAMVVASGALLAFVVGSVVARAAISSRPNVVLRSE